ncbi:hypothetical protein GCM10009763_04250 [Dermacoccus profundi]|uniref:Uncharacterized protein n=2 Tax=Dermacoccus TaxID=57495 RepID=A0ABN2BB63_9MICO
MLGELDGIGDVVEESVGSDVGVVGSLVGVVGSVVGVVGSVVVSRVRLSGRAVM